VERAAAPLLLHKHPGSSGAALLDWHLWSGSSDGESGGGAYLERGFLEDVRHLQAWLECT
jgi:hypothetical protein